MTNAQLSCAKLLPTRAEAVWETAIVRAVGAVVAGSRATEIGLRATGRPFLHQARA